MTELGLIVGINCTGLLCAGMLVRWLLARDRGGSEMRRVEGAVRRAMVAFLWLQFRQVALAVAVLVVLAAGACGVLTAAGGPLSALEAAFWTTAGLVLGAISACLAAYAAAGLALSASVRTSAAVRISMDRALAIAVRAGGATGLLVETASVIGVLSLVVLPFAIKGGFSLPLGQAAPLVLELALLLPGYGLGVAVAALVVERGGSTYHCAGRFSAELAGDCRAGLSQDDPRNPAIIAELVGEHLGGAASRAVDLFLSATVANIASAIVGTVLFFGHHERFPGLLLLAFLPAAVRAFGVIASVFGIMVVRCEDAQAAAPALWRGQATTFTVALGGLLGAVIWLAGADQWGALVAAGATGMIAVGAAAHAARWRLDRRSAPARGLLDVLRTRSPSAATQGLAVGLQVTVLPVLLLSVVLLVAWRLGGALDLYGGSSIVLLVTLMVLLAPAPYLLAVGTFAPIASSARNLASLAAAPDGSDEQRRTARLNDAGRDTSTMAHTYLTLVGALAALLAACAVSLLATLRGVQAAPIVDLGQPIVLCSAALGTALVLTYAATTALSSVRGTRGVALEVGRQLRGFPRDRGVPQVPRDYTPSYRACIDLAARAALRRLLPTAGIVLLLPAGLAVILLALCRSVDAGLAPAGLASFVSVTAIVGLAAALAVDGARAAVCGARPLDRPLADPSGLAAVASAHTLAGVLGYSVGPAVHLLVKATAIAALAIAPFVI